MRGHTLSALRHHITIPAGIFHEAAIAQRANAGSDFEPVFFMIEAR